MLLAEEFTPQNGQIIISAFGTFLAPISQVILQMEHQIQRRGEHRQLCSKEAVTFQDSSIIYTLSLTSLSAGTGPEMCGRLVHARQKHPLAIHTWQTTRVCSEKVIGLLIH